MQTTFDATMSALSQPFEPIRLFEYRDLVMSKTDVERFVFYGTEYSFPQEKDFESFDFGSDVMDLLQTVFDDRNSFYHIGVLSMNPAAAEWLLDNPCFISYTEFSANIHPRAVVHMISNPTKINWEWFSSNANPIAVDHMMRNKSKINVEWLCSNTSPRAVHLLEEYVREKHPSLCWKKISSNVSCRYIILNNLDKVKWDMVCKNPAMIDLIKKELKTSNRNISYKYLSSNSHPDAIKILTADKKKVYWRRLSANKSAVGLMKANLVDVNWNWVFSNPAAIGMMNTKLDRKWCKSLYEYCFWHPYEDQYVDRWCEDTPAIPATRSVRTKDEMAVHHFRYISTLIKHEQENIDMIRLYGCKNGDQLEKKMIKLVASGSAAFKGIYESFKRLKDQRIIIVHSSSIQDLEDSNILEEVREYKLFAAKESHYALATRCIKILCEYESMTAAVRDQYADGHKLSLQDMYDLLSTECRPIVDVDYLKYLREVRRKIAHATSWDTLESI